MSKPRDNLYQSREQTDRQTDRRTDRQTTKQAGKQASRQPSNQTTNKQPTDRPTRQRDRQTDGQARQSRPTNMQIIKQHLHTHLHTHTLQREWTQKGAFFELLTRSTPDAIPVGLVPGPIALFEWLLRQSLGESLHRRGETMCLEGQTRCTICVCVCWAAGSDDPYLVHRDVWSLLQIIEYSLEKTTCGTEAVQNRFDVFCVPRCGPMYGGRLNVKMFNGAIDSAMLEGSPDPPDICSPEKAASSLP